MTTSNQLSQAPLISDLSPQEKEVLFKQADLVIKDAFSAYCKLHSIEDKNRAVVAFQAFYHWFASNLDGVILPALTPSIQGAPAHRLLPAFLKTHHVRNGIAGNWSNITLSHRPALKNPVESLTLMLLVQWADKTMLPLMTTAHKDVTAGTLDDAGVMTVVVQQMLPLATPVKLYGLDALYEQASEVGFTDMADAADKLHELVSSNPTNLPPDDVNHMLRLVSLIRSIVSVDVPEAVKRQFAVLQAVKALSSTKVPVEKREDVTSFMDDQLHLGLACRTLFTMGPSERAQCVAAMHTNHPEGTQKLLAHCAILYPDLHNSLKADIAALTQERQ
jgi:hypothetical protein